MTDKLETQSVVFLLFIIIIFLTIKGIGAGARETKVTLIVDLTKGIVKFCSELNLSIVLAALLLC